MLRLERAIDRCIKSLHERLDRLSPDNDWDDVESITSATTSLYKTLGARREIELLKQKLHLLELENLEMKKQLEFTQQGHNIKIELEALSRGTPADQIEFVRPQENLNRKNRSRLFRKKDQ